MPVVGNLDATVLFRRCNIGTGMFPDKAKCGFTDCRIAENRVDFGTDEQNVHAGVEPEHTEDDNGKAAVNCSVIT